MIYAASNRRIKLSLVVKALTNNTELISILNKLDHGISCSLLKEAETENSYKIYDQHINNACMIPKKYKKDTLTIFVAENIDCKEKTLSGK